VSELAQEGICAGRKDDARLLVAMRLQDRHRWEERIERQETATPSAYGR
jgi:hypothetical protein